QQHTVCRDRAPPPTPPCRRHQGHEDGQCEAQEQHGQGGQPGRQATIAMQTDEHPPGATHQPEGAKAQARQQSLPQGGQPAPCVHDQQQGPGTQQPGRVCAPRGDPRREGPSLQGAGQGRTDQHGRQLQTSSCSVGASARTTLNQRTEPPRANMTVKRKGPIWVTSPRRGTRPNSWATSPPMVSNSSSGNCASKASFTTSISASPATRWLPSASVKTLPPLFSSTSNSSSISPTISSSTSSMVMSPAVLPNSSKTMARWMRLDRNSRNKSLSPLDSGMNSTGRIKVRRLSPGALCSFSRSFASSTPMML